jgi:hypothetical protein
VAFILSPSKVWFIIAVFTGFLVAYRLPAMVVLKNICPVHPQFTIALKRRDVNAHL